MKKAFTITTSLALSTTILLTGCGKKEPEQQVYEERNGASVETTTEDVAVKEKDKQNNDTTENQTTEETNTDEMNTSENVEDQQRDDTSKTYDTPANKPSEKYQIRDIKQNDRYIEKLKHMPPSKIYIYEAESRKERPNDNLGKRDEFIKSITAGAKPINNSQANKVKEKVRQSYIDGLQYQVFEKVSTKTQDYSNIHFNGELNGPMSYSPFMRANFNLHEENVKVYQKGTDYIWYADLKTPTGLLGGTITGVYDGEDNYLIIKDTAITKEGKPFFDEDFKREIILYDQL